MSRARRLAGTLAAIFPLVSISVLSAVGAVFVVRRTVDKDVLYAASGAIGSSQPASVSS